MEVVTERVAAHERIVCFGFLESSIKKCSHGVDIEQGAISDGLIVYVVADFFELLLRSRHFPQFVTRRVVRCESLGWKLV